MNKVLAITMTILSCFALMILISVAISERDHLTTNYVERITCGLCGCPGYTVDYSERATLYSLTENELDNFWFLSLCSSLIGMVYVIRTRFGSTKPSLLDNLEKENEIIRKQIEKKELLAKLETLEKK